MLFCNLYFCLRVLYMNYFVSRSLAAYRGLISRSWWIKASHPHTRQLPEKNKQMPNNASTNLGSDSLVLKVIYRLLTARRPVYVPFRSKSGTCPATHRFLLGYGATRHPDRERADGLTRYGRLTARRERIFVNFSKYFQINLGGHAQLYNGTKIIKIWP